MITLDTNIYISAIVFGGRPATLLTKAVEGDVEVAISEPILSEVLRVLREKFGRSPEQIAEAEERIRSFTSLVTPSIVLDVVKEDPDDNRVLECAVASASDTIVTGDKDLLRLGNYRGIRILQPADLSEDEVDL